jgi:hypothetical protein
MEVSKGGVPPLNNLLTDCRRSIMKEFNEFINKAKDYVEDIKVQAEETGSEKLNDAKSYFEDELDMLTAIYEEMKRRGTATKESVSDLFNTFVSSVKDYMSRVLAWSKDLWNKFLLLFKTTEQALLSAQS